jgi:N-acyl-D-amino-acid deacylase
MKQLLVSLALIAFTLAGCARAPQYDVVIRHGTVYDGTGAAAKVEDLGIEGDRVVARGDLSGARGRQDIDATDLAVSPGFINMLSHSET